MKITVTSPQVHEKAWSKEGRSGVIRTQDAQAENPRFRAQCRLDLGTGEAYAPGIYELDLEANVSIGDFGDFKLARRPTLKLLQSTPAAKAA